MAHVVESSLSNYISLHNRYYMKSTSLVSVFLLMGLVISACDDHATDDKTSGQIGKSMVSPGSPFKVESMVPDVTVAGNGFNRQPGGTSAISIVVTGEFSKDNLDLYFGNTKITNFNREGINLTDDLIAKPGKYPIIFKVRSTGESIPVGTFRVISP